MKAAGSQEPVSAAAAAAAVCHESVTTKEEHAGTAGLEGAQKEKALSFLRSSVMSAGRTSDFFTHKIKPESC